MTATGPGWRALLPAALALAAGTGAAMAGAGEAGALAAAAAGALAGGLAAGLGAGTGLRVRPGAVPAAPDRLSPGPAGRDEDAPAEPDAGAELAPAAPAGPSPGPGDWPLVEALPVGLLLVDPSRQVVRANAAARDLLGRLPPLPFDAAALRAPRLLEAIDDCGGAGGPAAETVELTLMRATETHLLCHLRRIAAPGRGGAVLVTVEDVTRSRRSEDLHRDFVANASHELKTPLASILASIETLQGHAREDPEARARFLALMQGQAGRMQRLVQDLLSLNRIERNERVPPRERVSLAEVVGETVDAMAPIAREAGIELSASLPPAALTLTGSREELGQLFQNLVDNAIRYGRRGDRVTVGERRDPARPGFVGMDVRDTGPGIAAAHLPRLTERFYRVSDARSRARGGTGLGLAIVKHVLTRHRGELEIESRPGAGSCFTVWLPLGPFPEGAEAGLPHPAPGTRRGPVADPHPAPDGAGGRHGNDKQL